MPGIPTKEEMRAVLAERHGEALQHCFESAVVAICGLGGLGSNIAISLARAGVGRLILIDFDRVDVSNLHRQQYKAFQTGMLKTEALAQNLREIAPYITLETHAERITAENFQRLLGNANVVCEAFDRPESKAMLVNGVLERLPDTFIVAASGMAGFEPANRICTRRVSRRFYLCGDGTSDVAQAGSLVAPRVMLCAAHQAHAVLRILAGQYEI